MSRFSMVNFGVLIAAAVFIFAVVMIMMGKITMPVGALIAALAVATALTRVP